MKVNLTSQFRKSYRLRVKGNNKLREKYIQRVQLFISDATNEVLRNHKLFGKLSGYCAFSITGDIRVLYYFNSDAEVTFIDIGSHNQVYTE